MWIADCLFKLYFIIYKDHNIFRHFKINLLNSVIFDFIAGF